jgi:hypothetical protein
MLQLTSIRALRLVLGFTLATSTPAIGLIAMVLASFARFFSGATQVVVVRVFLVNATVAVAVALGLGFSFNALYIFSSLEGLSVFISLSLLSPLLLHFRFIELRLKVLRLGVGNSASIYIS